MVEIRIIVEGGVLPGSNIDVLTINNSEKLREAFYKLLSKVIEPEKFNLIIELGAGVQNAAKSFRKYALIDNKSTLLIDLDDVKAKRNERLNELELNDFANRVFFMVQEMEAWIISQPHAIEKCFNERLIRKNPNISLAESEAELFSLHPEDVIHPSDRLNVLLGRYFLEMKGNQKKKKKYGKLKDAPLLIENLDVFLLMETFEDLRLLKNFIEREP